MHNKNNWQTIDTLKLPGYRRLNDRLIKQHLRGRNCYGVMFAPTHTKFLCFDVDIVKQGDGDINQAREVAEKLIHELRKHIDDKDIHLEYSGGKGYHIWLFWQYKVKISDIVSFADSIRSINDNPNIHVEIRPESNNSRGIKLPLGIHPNTGNMMVFLDKETFRPITDQYEYLLSITPMTKHLNWQKFYLAASDIKQIKTVAIDFDKEIINHEHLQNIWENGLPGPGIRHRYTFLLSIYFKEIGYTENEVIERLYWFTDREHNAGRTKDSAEKSLNDIVSTVGNVFKNNYHLGIIELTDYDYEIINSQPEHLRKTLTEIYKTAKIHNDNGYFYLNINKIITTTGQSKRTVYNHIKELENKLIFKALHGEKNIQLFGNEKINLSSLYYMPIVNQSNISHGEVVYYSFAKFMLEILNQDINTYRFKIGLNLNHDEILNLVRQSFPALYENTGYDEEVKVMLLVLKLIFEDYVSFLEKTIQSDNHIEKTLMQLNKVIVMGMYLILNNIAGDKRDELINMFKNSLMKWIEINKELIKLIN